jgi:hypothetical protein
MPSCRSSDSTDSSTAASRVVPVVDSDVAATADTEQGRPPATSGSGPSLSAAQVEQAFISYVRCVAAEAEEFKVRFRVDPLYGVLIEIGLNDPTGRREDELDRRCKTAVNLDEIIPAYQRDNPPRPDQIAELVAKYKACLSAIGINATAVGDVGKLDDISSKLIELTQLYPAQAGRIGECTEITLYGPILDLDDLGL